MEDLTAADVDRRTDALLEEAEAYFMGEGGVHSAAAAIAERLAEAGIDYAIAGAIALGEHGFKRLTVDVDVLIRREGLERFKAEWLGRGYVDVRQGGKAVRDTVNNVKIDFLLTGDFPGDDKPKPVAFPDPRDGAIAGDKYRVVSLPRLIEMKLASGMTAPTGCRTSPMSSASSAPPTSRATSPRRSIPTCAASSRNSGSPRGIPKTTIDRFPRRARRGIPSRRQPTGRRPGAISTRAR